MVNMLKLLTLFIITVVFTENCLAQKKVKYKNLYPLLQSRDFKHAEQDLLIYLANTDDEPNPYFYLGEILTERLDSVPIFPTSVAYDSIVDSAINAYKKSISLINEKEVRKNDEYYMAYNRRDLRTGKFGIKVSDVHLDYENKIKALYNKQKAVEEIHTLKEEAEKNYQELQNEINSLTSEYENKQAFLLRIEQAQMNTFDKIDQLFSAFETAAIAYQERINLLNHPFYKVEINKIEIKEWANLKDVEDSLDFERIVYKDYQNFFKGLYEIITTEIIPIKTLLLITNDSLDLAIKSNSNISDTTELIRVKMPSNLLSDFAKYSSAQVAFELLNYKQTKSRISELENAQLYPILSDSTNIYQRTNRINEVYKQYQKLEDDLKPVAKHLKPDVEKNMAFYLSGFKPSIHEWLTIQETVNSKRLKELKSQNDSLQKKIQYILIEKDTFWMPNFAEERKATSLVLFAIENDSSMILLAQDTARSIIAEVGYDMQTINFNELDSIHSIVNILKLQNDFILDIVSGDSIVSSHYILLFDTDLNQKWRLQVTEDNSMKSVKMEAGIIFIYNKEDEIYLTVSKAGKKIGD